MGKPCKPGDFPDLILEMASDIPFFLIAPSKLSLAPSLSLLMSHLSRKVLFFSGKLPWVKYFINVFNVVYFFQVGDCIRT